MRLYNAASCTPMGTASSSSATRHCHPFQPAATTTSTNAISTNCFQYLPPPPPTYLAVSSKTSGSSKPMEHHAAKEIKTCQDHTLKNIMSTSRINRRDLPDENNYHPATFPKVNTNTTGELSDEEDDDDNDEESIFDQLLGRFSSESFHFDIDNNNNSNDDEERGQQLDILPCSDESYNASSCGSLTTTTSSSTISTAQGLHFPVIWTVEGGQAKADDSIPNCIHVEPLVKASPPPPVTTRSLWPLSDRRAYDIAFGSDNVNDILKDDEDHSLIADNSLTLSLDEDTAIVEDWPSLLRNSSGSDSISNAEKKMQNSCVDTSSYPSDEQRSLLMATTWLLQDTTDRQLNDDDHHHQVGIDAIGGSWVDFTFNFDQAESASSWGNNNHTSYVSKSDVDQAFLPWDSHDDDDSTSSYFDQVGSFFTDTNKASLAAVGSRCQNSSDRRVIHCMPPAVRKLLGHRLQERYMMLKAAEEASSSTNRASF